MTKKPWEYLPNVHSSVGLLEILNPAGRPIYVNARRVQTVCADGGEVVVHCGTSTIRIGDFGEDALAVACEVQRAVETRIQASEFRRR